MDTATTGSSGLDAGAWLAAVATNSEQLAAAARAAGTEAPVPTCPEWRVSDLVGHMGTVHRWVAATVERGAQERISRSDLAQPPEEGDLISWLEAGAERLVAVLGAVDLGEQVWNWLAAGPAAVGFWHRRMAHETVIHRVDAEAAAGRESRVSPAELAADGIDEFLAIVAHRALADERPGSFEGTFHFHATDVTGEWQADVGPGRFDVRREHGKAAVAVRGPASDLELFLYNRRSSEGLEVFGDPALLDAWRAGTHL